MEGVRKFLQERAEEAGDVKGSNILDLLSEKLTQFLHFLQNIWASFSLDNLLDFLKKIWASAVEKVDEFLPPEKRSGILHYSLVFIGIAAVAAILYFFCRCFCRCFCCCCRGLGRTMKAPGRNGLRMRRAPFEADPKGYFRSLRAGEPLLLQ